MPLVFKCKALGSNLHGHYCKPLLLQTAGSESNLCSCYSLPCTRLCSFSPPKHTPYPAPLPLPLGGPCWRCLSRPVPCPFCRRDCLACHPSRHASGSLSPTPELPGWPWPGRTAHPPGLLAGAASATLCRTGAEAAPTARPAGPAGTQRARSGNSTSHPHGSCPGHPRDLECHHRAPLPWSLSLACVPHNHCGAASAHPECQGGHSAAQGAEQQGPTHPYSEPSRSSALFAVVWAECPHIHLGFIPHKYICSAVHVGPAGHVA